MPRVVVTPPEDESIVPIVDGRRASEQGDADILPGLLPDSTSVADLFAAAFPHHASQLGERHGE
ncbi:MAG: hypothetical protein WBP26_03020 [Candidatus Saccharimonadales bacterium]